MTLIVVLKRSGQVAEINTKKWGLIKAIATAVEKSASRGWSRNLSLSTQRLWPLKNIKSQSREGAEFPKTGNYLIIFVMSHFQLTFHQWNAWLLGTTYRSTSSRFSSRNFFSGKSIVILISFVTLIFLLFSDQISRGQKSPRGGKTGSGERSPPPPPWKKAGQDKFSRDTSLEIMNWLLVHTISCDYLTIIFKIQKTTWIKRVLCYANSNKQLLIFLPLSRVLEQYGAVLSTQPSMEKVLFK